MAVTATAFLPVLLITSKQAFASTVVSLLLEYTLEDTMTAGILFPGLSKVNATTEPTSIGNPWYEIVRL
jgi:hypothetical protein